MTEKRTEDKAYGWDESDIPDPNEGGFTIIPGGDYPFRVTKFVRERHTPNPDGSGSLPACNKAVIDVEIDGGEHGQVTVEHNLFLHSKCEGFLCQFFTSIGLREHGDPLRLQWDKVVGATGVCRVFVDKYTVKGGNSDDPKDQRESNKIKSFLDPPEAGQAEQGELEAEDGVPF